MLIQKHMKFIRDDEEVVIAEMDCHLEEQPVDFDVEEGTPNINVLVSPKWDVSTIDRSAGEWVELDSLVKENGVNYAGREFFMK